MILLLHGPGEVFGLLPVFDGRVDHAPAQVIEEVEARVTSRCVP